MPTINSKAKFIEELEEYTRLDKNNIEKNFTVEFENHQIIIDEVQRSGRGEVYLDISNYKNTNIFFIKIDNKQQHNIGIFKSHNDGIVLKINLECKQIEVFLFELKKTFKKDELEKAQEQLTCAYRFIYYLQLNRCFEVKYNFFLAYKNLHFNSTGLDFKTDIKQNSNKNLKYSEFLYNTIINNKNSILIKNSFCEDDKFNFQLLKFDETIAI